MAGDTHSLQQTDQQARGPPGCKLRAAGHQWSDQDLTQQQTQGQQGEDCTHGSSSSSSAVVPGSVAERDGRSVCADGATRTPLAHTTVVLQQH